MEHRSQNDERNIETVFFIENVRDRKSRLSDRNRMFPKPSAAGVVHTSSAGNRRKKLPDLLVFHEFVHKFAVLRNKNFHKLVPLFFELFISIKRLRQDPGTLRINLFRRHDYRVVYRYLHIRKILSDFSGKHLNDVSCLHRFVGLFGDIPDFSRNGRLTVEKVEINILFAGFANFYR